MIYVLKCVSKREIRSIGTVFAYEKYVIVSLGWGIAFGTGTEKVRFWGHISEIYLVEKGAGIRLWV